MKIAVIGTGIAGLGCAHLLERRHQVVLFEKDSRPGGHTNTFVTPDGQPVDTGFIVFNNQNYPNLTGLFRELDVAVQKTQMSFGVSLDGGRYEWAGSDNLLTVFAQPSNLFRPTHIRMLLEILKLNADCRKRLAANELPDGSLQQFLDDGGYSTALRSRYLLPMAGMIWSCSPRQAAAYPAADFMRFFDSHGLFTATRQPQWFSVKNGSQSYVRKILAAFKGEVRLNAGVTQLRRVDGQVLVSTDHNAELFDQVVCATHSDQALRLLVDGSAAERAVLGGVSYTKNRAILHTDESFLPKRRAAWASWNYTHPRDEIHDRPIEGSYWMNQLQHIAGPVNYIVTLNPTREPPPDKLLHDIDYEHPHYTAAAQKTHRQLPAIQGRNHIWWAGAWCGYGFHEDGLKSAVAVARALGCPPSWDAGSTEPAVLEAEAAPSAA